MCKACGCMNTQHSTAARIKKKFLKTIKSFTFVAVPEHELTLKFILGARATPQPQTSAPHASPSSPELLCEAKNSAHALIKKRFLFIRQHATQQQAQTILRIMAENKAPEGSDSDTERMNITKKSSQNCRHRRRQRKFSARSSYPPHSQSEAKKRGKH